jgi:hypothetical protein
MYDLNEAANQAVELAAPAIVEITLIDFERGIAAAEAINGHQLIGNPRGTIETARAVILYASATRN